MKNVFFGNTGLKVSPIALGTMTFGLQSGIHIHDATKIFTAYTKENGNFIDTANIYNNGESEKIIGDFVSSNRDDFVLASKFVFASSHQGTQFRGANRKSLKLQLDTTLKNLQTDYLDILYIHGFDPYTPYEETINALNDVIASGKVLYVAASNVPAWWLAQANAFAKCHNKSGFEGIQVFHNLLERSAERELLPYANFEKLSFLSWSPLNGGLLTDKYLKHANSEGRMSKKAGERLGNHFNKSVLDVVHELATKHKASISQVALAWQLQRNIIPVVGASKEEQIVDNLKAGTLILSDEDMKQLNLVSAIEAGIPLSYLQQDRGANSLYAETVVNSPLMDYCHGGGFDNKTPW